MRFKHGDFALIGGEPWLVLKASDHVVTWMQCTTKFTTHAHQLPKRSSWPEWVDALIRNGRVVRRKRFKKLLENEVAAL